MTLFYCSDILARKKIHNYFRSRGVELEAIALPELELAASGEDVNALLVCGEIPMWLLASLNSGICVIYIGKFALSGALCFRDYTDSDLYALLLDLSGKSACFCYNGVLHFKEGKSLYLGYPLELTPTEYAVLYRLAENAESGAASKALTDICLGDFHLSADNISNYVSGINAKARIIGGRNLIEFSEGSRYKISKYI